MSDDRRERARDEKRRRFLAGAGRVVDERGLAGLTMQAVAEQLDCAVGTIYTYFDSKAALVAAMQDEAVTTLVASWRTALGSWSPLLEEEGEIDDALRTLVLLEAWGGFFCAASVVLADEFHLQRLLLTSRPPGGDDDRQGPLAAVHRLCEIPRGLLAEAGSQEVIEPGDDLDRTVRWLAALDGVLLLDEVASLDRHLFRAQHHGRELSADLLTGWGADRADVEVAASHVDRLAALGPLAPPPEGPGFG